MSSTWGVISLYTRPQYVCRDSIDSQYGIRPSITRLAMGQHPFVSPARYDASFFSGLGGGWCEDEKPKPSSSTKIVRIASRRVEPKPSVNTIRTTHSQLQLRPVGFNLSASATHHQQFPNGTPPSPSRQRPSPSMRSMSCSKAGLRSRSAHLQPLQQEAPDVRLHRRSEPPAEAEAEASRRPDPPSEDRRQFHPDAAVLGLSRLHQPQCRLRGDAHELDARQRRAGRRRAEASQGEVQRWAAEAAAGHEPVCAAESARAGRCAQL